MEKSGGGGGKASSSVGGFSFVRFRVSLVKSARVLPVIRVVGGGVGDV